ncbi:hypothetical protein MY4038_010124 [Beauveria bassiana]
MAATALNPVLIPGLHAPPGREDMEKATLLYNSLPDDKNQPEISVFHLNNIKELIVKYGVQEKLGIHLVHGHLQIDHGSVMHGTPMTNIRGCWSRPTAISNLDVSNIHGHIFAISPNGHFQAYEYRNGAPPNIEVHDEAFIAALCNYLREHQLESLIGLQVLNEDKNRELQEFVLGDNNGVVMLDAADTNITDSYRVTGYAVHVDESDAKVLKGGEKHAPTVKQTHQVFTDGKPLPDELSLLGALRSDGVIG